MSKGDRDMRGRPHSGKKCPDSKAGGCEYCITGEIKRFYRRKDRHDAKKEVRNDEHQKFD